MIKRMSQILWGSPAEEQAMKQKIENSPDPAELTIEKSPTDAYAPIIEPASN